MIMCCRQKHKSFVRIVLCDEKLYKDRILEVVICPICGALIAELTQTNTKTGKKEIIRPKRKQTASFIQKMQMQKWKHTEIKTGTKGNQGFVYGENREHKNGKIYQYSVDFNGEKKLVKIVKPLNNLE